ncbi:MAG: DUF2064 domain-containing protein [Planctomycetota bacterium]
MEVGSHDPIARHPVARHPVVALVFAKLPRPGVTKTRLARTYGPEVAARLAGAFLLDTLTRVTREPDLDVLLLGDQPERAAFADYLASSAVGYGWQGEGDLGDRQVRGLTMAFAQGWRGAIVLGADAPHLRREDLHAARAAVLRAEVAVGPALDGGYVLLGWPSDRDPEPALRGGFDWGSPSVLSTLQARLTPPWVELPPTEDFDEAPALERWWRARASRAGAPPLIHTERLLAELLGPHG